VRRRSRMPSVMNTTLVCLDRVESKRICEPPTLWVKGERERERGAALRRLVASHQRVDFQLDRQLVRCPRSGTSSWGKNGGVSVRPTAGEMPP
jgi:hypothetical protein